ncbi:adenylate kinase [Aureococcus anophagefferens]|nr:adenylate kinase [Aureococcus anophagefferens]
MPRTIAALILAVASALVTPPRRKTTTLAARAKTRTPYDFTYASAAERATPPRRRCGGGPPRGAPAARVASGRAPRQASGKGTIAPMLCTAYRVAQVGLGNLLRSRARVGGGGDDAVADAMRSGRLLPDELALSVVAERVSRRDAVACGWLLDGFPRTAAQAARMIKSPPLQVPADLPFDGPPMGDDAYLLTPDAIVVLDRPDDLAVDFVLGRCTDSATGTVYHPKYAPPPEDVEPRLVWRTDDTEEVLRRRLADHDAAVDDILAMFSESCAVLRVDNARSELETFDEICTFLDKVEDDVLGASRRAVRGERARRRYAAPAAFERASTKAARRGAEECDARRRDAGWAPLETGGLLRVVERCNYYDAAMYAPVLCGGEPVGAVSGELLRKLKGLGLSNAVEVGPNPLPYTASVDGDDDVASKAVVLAPNADSVGDRTRVVAALVEALVADSELLAERGASEAIATCGRRVEASAAPPLLRMERAAVVAFGVVSYGCHVSGYVAGDDGRPAAVWVATRALSKPTYAGLYDQIAAGGLPAELTLLENAKKEAEEEASIPRAVLDRDLRPAGCVSYKYAAKRGLSAKTLVVFDLRLPRELVPMNGDGEVDEFRLVPVDEAVDSLRDELFKWKPNSALVMLDFAMRHGFVDPDDPEFVPIAQALRQGG